MGESVVTKKVRLNAGEAATLARLARQGKTTESEVLRAGLRRMELQRRRAATIEEFIRFLGPEVEPPKLPFRLG